MSVKVEEQVTKKKISAADEEPTVVALANSLHSATGYMMQLMVLKGEGRSPEQYFEKVERIARLLVNAILKIDVVIEEEKYFGERCFLEIQKGIVLIDSLLDRTNIRKIIYYRTPRILRDNEYSNDIVYQRHKFTHDHDFHQKYFDLYYDKLVKLLDRHKAGRPTAPQDINDDNTSSEKLFAPAEAKAVGAMFERAREGAGLNKKQAERASGIHTANLRKLESGDTSPSLEKMQQYADALGLEARIELVPKDQS